jgi:hypothetical protein
LFCAKFREGTLIKKRPVLLAEAGLELLSDSSGKTRGAAKSGAESGALFSDFEPPLREAAHAWMALSADARNGMRAIVRAVNHYPKPVSPKR